MSKLDKVTAASLRRKTIRKLAEQAGATPQNVESLVSWIKGEHHLSDHEALKLAARAIRVNVQKEIANAKLN